MIRVFRLGKVFPNFCEIYFQFPIGREFFLGPDKAADNTVLVDSARTASDRRSAIISGSYLCFLQRLWVIPSFLMR